MVTNVTIFRRDPNFLTWHNIVQLLLLLFDSFPDLNYFEPSLDFPRTKKSRNLHFNLTSYLSVTQSMTWHFLHSPQNSSHSFSLSAYLCLFVWLFLTFFLSSLSAISLSFYLILTFLHLLTSTFLSLFVFLSVTTTLGLYLSPSSKIIKAHNYASL